jgi:hypothetical protein
MTDPITTILAAIATIAVWRDIQGESSATIRMRS